MMAQIFPNLNSKGIDSVDETSRASDVSGQVLKFVKKAAAVNDNHGYDLIVISDTMLRTLMWMC